MYKFGIYLVAACLNLAASVGSAQTNYPNRPIKFIVPFPPGAATDVIARTFAQSMSETLGQPVVVENKAGAGGIVGTEAVATSAPDGYSILLITTEYVINQSLRKNLSYTTQSFAPISAMASYPVFLAASAKLGIKDLAALMTAAKTKPESIRYYSWGSGSSGHLAMQMLNDAAQVKMMHVPYKGLSPAIADLLNGTVDIGWIGVNSGAQHFAAGTLVPLGVSSKIRDTTLSTIPPIHDTYAGYDISFIFGLAARAGTPADILDKLLHAVQIAAKSPNVITALSKIGVLTTSSSTRNEYEKFLSAEAEKWKAAVANATVVLD